MAPKVGFEPTANSLTANRSTTELLWYVKYGPPDKNRTRFLPVKSRVHSIVLRTDNGAPRRNRTSNLPGKNRVLCLIKLQTHDRDALSVELYKGPLLDSRAFAAGVEPATFP